MAWCTWQILLLWLVTVNGHPGVAATADAGDIDELFKDEGFLRMSRSGESFGNNRPPPPPILLDARPPSISPPQPQQNPLPSEVVQGPRKGVRSSNDAATIGNAAAVMPSVSFLDLAFGLDRSPLEKNIAAVFSKVSFAHTGNSTGGKNRGDSAVVSSTSTTPTPTRVVVTATIPTPTPTSIRTSATTHVTYASNGIEPQQPLLRPPLKDTLGGSSNNDTEYDFVPILQNPTVTRILAGSTGKRPPPTLIHLPEEIQRRLRENRTSFLNEVNKDSMIDVKPQLPTISSNPQPDPIPISHRPPVYPSYSYPQIPVTQQLPTEDPETIPPSPSQDSIGRPSVVAGGAIVSATSEPVYPIDTNSDPGPDRASTPTGLSIAWDVHVYLMGGLFALLALYSLVSLVRLHGQTHLLPKGYFLTLNTLMLIVGTLRALFLCYDAYNFHQSFPPMLAYLLLHIAFPCLTSAFAVLFLALLRATQLQVNILGSRFQRPSLLVSLVLLHFVVTVAADIIVGCIEDCEWLLLVAQMLSLVWALVLAVAYLCAFGTMYRAALRQQGEIIRATFTKMHIEGAALPKRLPRPTLGLAVRVAFAVALLAVLLAVLQIYGVFGIYGVSGLGGMVGEPRPRPWPWWGFLLSERVIEVAIGGLIAFLSTRPIRCHDPDQNMGCVTMGNSTPRSGATPTNNPDRTAVFALFGCGTHLGCGPGLCRCSMSQPSEEGKTPGGGGDDMYPTICSSNQAIRNYSITTGKTVYDDSFPLSQGPTKALGDKVLPLAAMAKRRPLKKGATLLSTLADGRSTIPAACHQMEQPGRRGLYAASLDATDTSSGDALSYYPTSSVRAKCSSTCSSESAANSFDVRLYPPHMLDSNGVPLFRAEDIRRVTRTGGRNSSFRRTPLDPGEPPPYPSRCVEEQYRLSVGNTRENYRKAHHVAPPLPPHYSISPLPTDFTSRSDLNIDFLTDVSTSQLSNDEHFSDSDVASSVEPSGYEDNADDEHESDGGGGRPVQLPTPCTVLNLNLPSYNTVLRSTSTSQDVTPDSAVVADISETSYTSSKNEVALGDGVGGVPFLQESDQGFWVASESCNVPSRAGVRAPPTLPVSRSPGMLRISTSSLNDVLNGCGVSAKGLLSKLKGSNFSLNGPHYGYSPLGSEDLLHQRQEWRRLMMEAGRPLEVSVQAGETHMRPLLASPTSTHPLPWDVHTSPLVSPSYYRHHQPCFSSPTNRGNSKNGGECWSDISPTGYYCDNTGFCRSMPVPHLNDLSIETRVYQSDEMNINPDLYPPSCGHRYNVELEIAEQFCEEESVV